MSNIRIACYEAGPRCNCNKASCGGVRSMNFNCPEHGTNVVQIRIHDCWRKREATRTGSGSQ